MRPCAAGVSVVNVSSLGIGFALLFRSNAAADWIVPIAQDRSVYVASFASDPTGSKQETNLHSAAGFGKYQHDVNTLSVVSPPNGAQAAASSEQNTWITANEIGGKLELDAWATTFGEPGQHSTSQARATADVTFELTSPATYQLEGRLERETLWSKPDEYAMLVLMKVGGAALFSVQSGNAGPTYFSHSALPPAGKYRLWVEIFGNMQSPSAFEWSEVANGTALFSFVVPEPAPAALFALGALLLAGRRGAWRDFQPRE